MYTYHLNFYQNGQNIVTCYDCVDADNAAQANRYFKKYVMQAARYQEQLAEFAESYPGFTWKAEKAPVQID